MKTDSLFYELFKLHPKSLFEIAGLEADGEYVFESITEKAISRLRQLFCSLMRNTTPKTVR